MRNLIVLFLVFSFGCTKENTTPSTGGLKNPGAGGATNCRISKSTSGSTVFTYTEDASGKIIESVATSNGQFQNVITYEYSGNALYKSTTYTDPAKTQLASQMIYTKTDNSVTLSTYLMLNGALTEYNREVYVLVSGKLSEKRYYSLQNGQMNLTSAAHIETDANGNITRHLAETYSVNYTYDTRTNYQLAYPAATVLPTGGNNVLTFTTKDTNGNTTNSKTYSYTYNDEGLPVTNSGQTTYEYNCK